jgi:hypothetical protein
VEQTFKSIKVYITVYEVNLVDLFTEQDKDDGYLNRNEFSNILEKFGFPTMGPEHEDRIEAFFVEFDHLRTLKLDIDTIINRFYQYAESVAPKLQPSIEYLIADIRKFMKDRKMLSLAPIFFKSQYITRHQ